MEQAAKRFNEVAYTVMAGSTTHVTSSATFDIPLIGGKDE